MLGIEGANLLVFAAPLAHPEGETTVARHDREDPHSLEEQLAWLDSIKENEEVPAAVSASVDDAAGASP